MNLNTIIKEFRIILDKLTIKYSSLAKQNETVETTKAADIYIGAMYGNGSFSTYKTFSQEAIRNVVGSTFSDEEVFNMSLDKYSIPIKYRELLPREEDKIIIRDYVELNNYYRMLNGLPDTENSEEEYIYLDEEICNRYNIIYGTPIHLVDYNILSALEADGVIDTLISSNPDKKYLKHLASNKISIFDARLASNFSILNVNKGVQEDFYTNFVNIYDQNREYFMSVIYNNDFANKYDMYDNFIALCIFIMTIQRIIANSFKYGIKRNFYDWSFIQNMYKTYSLSFIEDLSIEHHIIILKNLNNLLRHKSTDKVLFDICSILGQERMKIFRYYLIKKQKMNKDNKPIFYYKEVEDENGNKSLIEDKERMYNLYFQSVNIKDRNIALALDDTNNVKKYSEIIADDPFWEDSEELQKVLYDSEFNYVESKYIGLNMMYKMTEMLFEVTYAFRMLIDKKDEIVNYRMELPKIYSEKNFKIFDVIIFMICLICKRSGFETYTITTPSKISHIYGFNFDKDDIECVKNIIKENSRIIDKDINKYIINLTINSANDANRLFKQIREFNDWIIAKMNECQNLKEYNIYKKIFKILMVEKVNTEMFTYVNGEGNKVVAKSYMEYLGYADPILCNYVTTIEEGKIAEAIEHTSSKLNQFMDSLKYLHILNDTNSPLVKSIISLIRFFKSYSVDLTSFNIIYLFDSKFYNLIKIISDINHVDKLSQIEDDIFLKYQDTFGDVNAYIDYVADYIISRDKYKEYINIDINENIDLEDILDKLDKTLVSKDNNELLYSDILMNLVDNIYSNDDLSIYDKLMNVIIKYYNNDIISSDDVIRHMVVIFDKIKEYKNYKDIVVRFSDIIRDNENKELYDKYKEYINIDINENIDLEDILDKLDKTLVSKDNNELLYSDIHNKHIKKLEYNDNICMRDKIVLKWSD